MSSIPTFKLSKDQLEKTKRIFNSLDTDRSGYIEVRELGPVVKLLETLNVTIDRKSLEVVVGKFDKSKSGRLNLDQFSQMLVYLLDLKNSAPDVHAQNTTQVTKITIKGGPNKPTVTTTTTTTSSSHHKAPPLPPKSALHRSDSGLSTGSSSSHSPSAPPVHRVASLPAHSSSSHLIVKSSQPPKKKAPLRRLKDAFSNYHRQINQLLSGSGKEEHAPVVTVTVASKEKQPHPPPAAPTPPRSSASSASTSRSTPSSTPFVDSSFPANNSVLPRHASGAVEWKRPHEVSEDPRLFVNGTEEGDVVQGALGDCWFVGALAVLATSGNEFIEHSFVKADMSKGEFKCKFYKDGEWVVVTVDDRIPCGASGKPLFAKCLDPNEWWVPILEKAYAKLHGGYDALESGTITDALKDMSGEAVQIIRVNEDVKYKDKSVLWRTLVDNIKESFLMGCAIEDSGSSAEQENGYGLLANHAYSIIDCQEVQGHKLIRIRNPWGKGEWKGPWSDDSKEWTPSLKKHFDFEFGNDGTFFMKFEDFIRFYNRIHVLCLLTDDQGEVWKKYTKIGRWKGETAGGCSNNRETWPNNPQYCIMSSTADNKVLIELSQVDLRRKHKKSPGKHGLRYEAIGFILLSVSEPPVHKVTAQDSFVKESGTPDFMGSRDTSFNFVAQKDQPYVLLPCTFNARVEQPFELMVYAQRSIKLYELSK